MAVFEGSHLTEFEINLGAKFKLSSFVYKADLMLYLGYDKNNKKNNGIAWIGTVCSPDTTKKLQKFSIVRWQESSAQAGADILLFVKILVNICETQQTRHNNLTENLLYIGSKNFFMACVGIEPGLRRFRT